LEFADERGSDAVGSRLSDRPECGGFLRTEDDKYEWRPSVWAVVFRANFLGEDRDHRRGVRVADVVLRSARHEPSRPVRAKHELDRQEVRAMIALGHTKREQTARLQARDRLALERLVIANQDREQAEEGDMQAVRVCGAEIGERFEEARVPP